MTEPWLGLIVDMPWARMLVKGFQTWEIRSSNTNVRGCIAIIQKGTGLIIGEVRLVDSFPVTREQMEHNQHKHRMFPAEVDAELFHPGTVYAKPYAWVMRDAVRYARPRRYQYPNGAVIWVRLPIR